MWWVKRGQVFFHHCVAVTLGALARTKPQGYNPFFTKILEEWLFYLSVD